MKASTTQEKRVPRISRDSLMSLETYAKERKRFRSRVLSHKKPRTVQLGDHATLLFEDELTIRYQIQEMLRIEKTFEEAGIQDELDVYNPLVPDGSNWKATMLIEYEDVEERRRALARLRGIEERVWIQVEGSPRFRPRHQAHGPLLETPHAAVRCIEGVQQVPALPQAGLRTVRRRVERV